MRSSGLICQQRATGRSQLYKSRVDPQRQFYTGGFQARYGDEISSALDIQYRRPTNFGGSVYVGVLEQGLHLEGVGADGRFTYLVGVRNRTDGSLLSSQETKGSYAPSSSDVQALLTWQLNSRDHLELLGTLSQTRFHLIPQSEQLTSSIYSPYYTANLGLDVSFQGQEKDAYQTNMLGLSYIQQVNDRLRLKWMASAFEDREVQNFDIIGDYLFGERDFDQSNATFRQIVNPLGEGAYQNFARDELNITVWNFTHKGYLDLHHHYVQWGLSAERQIVHDHIDEWTYQDSAGYSLPYEPGIPGIGNVAKSTDTLGITRLSGFRCRTMLYLPIPGLLRSRKITIKTSTR